MKFVHGGLAGHRQTKFACSGRGRLRNVGFKKSEGGIAAVRRRETSGRCRPKWPFSRKFSEQSVGFRRAIRSAAILIIAEYQRSITLPPRRNAQHCVAKQAAGQMPVDRKRTRRNSSH